ncbi:hypothetical protein D3C72_194580 [compost metagenome]
MTSVDNKAIKIPSDHYVGFQKRQNDDVPLAFMTIDGTDKAAIKRKATVDAWAKGNTWQSHNKQATLAPKSLVNKPLSGFKMGRNISYGSGWDSRHDKWRLEDPRGFQLEISSGNLQQIMQLCTLEKGEILEQCIWGRLGNENILIPISSPVYTTAAANTDRMNKKGTIKDAKPGSKLIFVNGDEGIYVGKTFASGYNYSSEYRKKGGYDYDNRIVTRDFTSFNEKAIHTYYLVDKDGNPTRVMMRDSLKLSEVIDGEDLTIEQTCDYVNSLIANKSFYVDLPNKYSSARVLQFSPALVTDHSSFEFFIKEIATFDDLIELTDKSVNQYYHTNYTIVKTPDDLYGYGHFYKDPNNPPTTAMFRSPRRIEKDALFNNKEKVMMSKEEKYMAYQNTWSYSGPQVEKFRTVADNLDLKAWQISDLSFVKIMGRYTTFSGAVHERDMTDE